MSFVLDRPNSLSPTFIFFRKMIGGVEFKYPIKEKVDPSKWDRKLRRVSAEKSGINLILDKINLVYQEILLQHKLNGWDLKYQVLEEAFDKALGRGDKKASLNFYSFIDELIKARETGKVLTKKGHRFSKSSIAVYKSAKKYLYQFDPNMNFNNITIETYHALISYMNDEEYCLNSIGMAIRNWIVFLKESYKAGIHNNKVFDHDDFVTPVELTDAISLTLEEINLIYKLDIKNPGKDSSRDWLVIGYFTGLRIIDWEALAGKKQDGEFITMVNEKTDFQVTIPKHPYIKAIEKKWNGMPPILSRQTISEHLKEIAKEAGIEGSELKTVTKGGKRVDSVVLRHDLVMPHTGRRSFITNLLESGAKDHEVMQLSGIKTHAVLMRYKKTKPKKTAEIMASHPFFNLQLPLLHAQ